MKSQVFFQPSVKGALQKLAKIGLVPLLTLCIVIVMAWIEPRFFNRLNIINILRNFSLLTLISIGQMLVMVVGGFDLSIGAIMAFSSVISALTMQSLTTLMPDMPLMIILSGVAAGLLSGVAMGMVNGVLVARFNLSSFMTTLAMMSVIGGATFYITRGVPVDGVVSHFVSGVGRGLWFNLPVIFWVVMLLALLFWLCMEYTVIGRHLYATGGHMDSARASGIDTGGILVIAYAASGLLAAVAGILITSRIGSGQPGLGATAAIESIAAAVVGGVSLRGGVGKISRVIMAALFLSLLANVLNLARIDSKWQTFVLGFLLIAAVVSEVRHRSGGHHE
ncbi:ABC transporter permease [Brenneria goodwinii]|uniref:Ribose ABC transport system, permease protein RbsC (TC 3.A.1.2.1) n=1 Tax=Brenneria goodwinii TaxID=1109412 RepID=A0A0G4JPY7_9GAMM|nr:ABC transporter permease [Brenneria goodwinii]MCG8155522.1 ABC transporter permease [Brenneria goodwinii]MCG8160451.1 ABC transporter permease [Brenneria goodwinii]MCG8164974.1 ABC transporter permease [Brenneria goodwinii]MCG8169369.1 ABC transporter permease [Brenneria goodwinii]MCG8174543.1 ABC transporter permease [Brenneria goodwinii]